MKKWKNLIASNEIEEKILDYANKASKMSKELDKMSESLFELEHSQEVSEIFKDLLEELSEVSYKSAIALSIVNRFGKMVYSGKIEDKSQN